MAPVKLLRHVIRRNFGSKTLAVVGIGFLPNEATVHTFGS